MADGLRAIGQRRFRRLANECERKRSRCAGRRRLRGAIAMLSTESRRDRISRCRGTAGRACARRVRASDGLTRRQCAGPCCERRPADRRADADNAIVLVLVVGAAAQIADVAFLMERALGQRDFARQRIPLRRRRFDLACAVRRRSSEERQRGKRRQDADQNAADHGVIGPRARGQCLAA